MEIETREISRFIITAEFSEFENLLNNMLFKIFGRSAKRVTTRNESDFSTHLEYLVFHTIFDYKVLVVDEGLDIYLSVRNGLLSENDIENVQIHIEQITNEINNKFESAGFPLGFKNLVLDISHSKVMEDLWIESKKTQKAKAYLSTIVLLGSILEGVLYYKITKNSENMAKAGRCTSAPKDSKQKVLPFDKWSLNDMILVSYKCGWIDEYSYGYSESLRRHRNFIHPFLQLDEMFVMPNEKACEISRAALKGIFDNLLIKEP
jgi:hypothetical protein